jgi:hypothetical protein
VLCRVSLYLQMLLLILRRVRGAGEKAKRFASALGRCGLALNHATMGGVETGGPDSSFGGEECSASILFLTLATPHMDICNIPCLSFSIYQGTLTIHRHYIFLSKWKHRLSAKYILMSCELLYMCLRHTTYKYSIWDVPQFLTIEQNPSFH